MATETKPGLREAVYLDGANISGKVTSFSMTPEYARKESRLGNGTFYRLGTTWYTGAPVTLKKFTFQITFQLLTEADTEWIERVSANDGSFDFCPWRFITERFTSTSGNLSKRNAISVIVAPYLPDGYATKYAHKSWENGAAGNCTVGAVDSTNYRQAWAAGSAGYNEITYYPVFRVYMTQDQPGFSLPTQETRTITLRER